MNRMHPLALEGRACVASYDGRLDELVVYVAHQLPVPLQIGLSQVLGISQRRVRVVAPDVGASFGLKTYVESETVCVANNTDVYEITGSTITNTRRTG